MRMTDMGMGTVAEQEWWQNTGMADYSYSLNSSRDFKNHVYCIVFNVLVTITILLNQLLYI
jgi:hypothetical protein